MKCSKCNHFVLTPYEGCQWCNLDDYTKEQLSNYDQMIDQFRATKDWESVKKVAAARVRYLLEVTA